MEMQTINNNNQEINIKVVGSLFQLEKLLDLIKRASEMIGFKYKVERVE